MGKRKTKAKMMEEKCSPGEKEEEVKKEGEGER